MNWTLIHTIDSAPLFITKYRSKKINGYDKGRTNPKRGNRLRCRLKKGVYPVSAFMEGAWWADWHQPTPWIDVNDALPPYDEDVIVATRLKNEEEFDFRFGHRAPAKSVKKDKNSFAIFMDGERVVYRMRLPKLPDTNTVNS